MSIRYLKTPNEEILHTSFTVADVFEKRGGQTTSDQWTVIVERQPLTKDEIAEIKSRGRVGTIVDESYARPQAPVELSAVTPARKQLALLGTVQPHEEVVIPSTERDAELYAPATVPRLQSPISIPDSQRPRENDRVLISICHEQADVAPQKQLLPSHSRARKRAELVRNPKVSLRISMIRSVSLQHGMGRA